MDHLRRIVQKETPLFLDWLYRLRIYEQTDEKLISQALEILSAVSGQNLQRSHLIPTRAWQHCYWAILHAVGFYLSELSDRALTIKFAKLMLRFDELLPCNACKAHYATKKTNVAWQLYAGIDPGLVIIKLHNSVSESIRKPLYSIQQVCDLYGVSIENRNTQPAFDFETFMRVLKEVDQSQQWNKQVGQLGF